MESYSVYSCSHRWGFSMLNRLLITSKHVWSPHSAKLLHKDKYSCKFVQLILLHVIFIRRTYSFLFNTKLMPFYLAMTAKVVWQMLHFQLEWSQTFMATWTKLSQWTLSHPAEKKMLASLQICPPSILSTPWFKVDTKHNFKLIISKYLWYPNTMWQPPFPKMNQKRES